MAVFVLFILAFTISGVSAQNQTADVDEQTPSLTATPEVTTQNTQKIDPQITVKNKTAKTNTSTQLEATLPNDATGKAVFKINDITIGKAFKVNGGRIKYNYSIPLYSARDYKLEFVYSGNDKYESSRTNATLTLTKLRTTSTLKTNTSLAVQGDEITFNVKLKNQLSNGYANKFVIKLNGKTIGSNTTDANGTGKLYYTLPGTYKMNTYNVTMKYGETNTAYGGEDTTTFRIYNPTHTTLKTTTMTKTGTNATLNATVTDKRNRNVTSGQVVFKINGLTIAKVNVTNGSASYFYNIPLYGAKAYNITALYGGNSYYNTSDSTKKLYLTKRNTKLTPVAFNTTVGVKNSTLIKVVDEFNKTVNGNLSLIIDNQTVGIFKVRNGTANISYTPKNNQSNTIVKYTARFDEDNFYRSSSGTGYIVVKPLSIVYVSNNGSNTNLGDKTHPYKTIKYATEHVVNGGTIYLNPGTYTESNINLTRSYNIIGINSSLKTIINAQKNPYVFKNLNASNYLSIANVTIKNAKVTQNYSAAVVSNGNLYITGCIFEDNTATANTSTSSIYAKKNLTITSSQFRNNDAKAFGGVVRTNGYRVIITKSKFIDNQISGDNIGGGALYLVNSTSTIQNSNFTRNHVNGANATGGAIYKLYGNMTLSNNIFLKNNLTGSDYVVGGAIYNYNDYVIVQNTSFKNNALNSTSFAAGGALYNQNSVVFIYNTSLSSNNISAKNTYGGAIYNANVYMHLSGVNITSNNAASKGNLSMGGAIHSNQGTLIITQSKIEDNHVKANNSYAGAIYFAGKNLTINETKISKNTANATKQALGGAILTGANTTITKTNITDNKAKGKTGYGGAIFNAGNLTVHKDNFISNTATTKANTIFNNNGKVKSATGNYWGAKYPSWTKQIYGFTKPSSYSKTLI